MPSARRLIVDAELRYQGQPTHRVRRLTVSVSQPPARERPEEIVVFLYPKFARAPIAELRLTRRSAWELAELLDEAATARKFE